MLERFPLANPNRKESTHEAGSFGLGSRAEEYLLKHTERWGKLLGTRRRSILSLALLGLTQLEPSFATPAEAAGLEKGTPAHDVLVEKNHLDPIAFEGCDVEFVAPPDKEQHTEVNYIIHLGQVHKPLFSNNFLQALADPKDSSRMVENQRAIEKLLKELRKTGALTVFVEGISSLEGTADTKRIIENYRSLLSTRSRDENGGNYVLFLYEKALRSNNTSPAAREYITFYTKQWIFETANTVEKTNPEKAQKLRTDFEKCISEHYGVYFNMIKDVDLIPYVTGTAFKMYLEGEIDLAPAESRTLNVKAAEAIEVLDATPQPSSTQLEQYEEAVFTNRELKAVEIIGNDLDHAGVHTTKLVPLVYGVAHDFSNEVLDYNKKNPTGKKLGLISIVPLSEGH